MLNTRLILASSSPARKALLEKLLIPFQIVPSHIDETPFSNEKPDVLALRLSIEKAKAIGHQFPKAYIIGSDQVVMCGDIRLDKPETIENAVNQLSLVSGKSVISYTGLCLWNAHSQTLHTGIETCTVDFRHLSDKTIASYIERDNPLHCAGSIKAEGLGMTLFTAIKSKDPNALLGLPMILLTDFLLAENII
jgi:MAF protein